MRQRDPHDDPPTKGQCGVGHPQRLTPASIPRQFTDYEPCMVSGRQVTEFCAFVPVAGSNGDNAAPNFIHSQNVPPPDRDYHLSLIRGRAHAFPSNASSRSTIRAGPSRVAGDPFCLPGRDFRTSN
jgi:hypothetical protein